MMEKTGISVEDLTVLTAIKNRHQLTDAEAALLPNLRARGLVQGMRELTTQGEEWLKAPKKETRSDG
ncbi:MAG: hypothetical protein ABFE08_05405 [Armatimonadia bacterium]